MNESDDQPRLPEQRFELPPRELSDVRPGEQVILHIVRNLAVDQEGRVWVDMWSKLHNLGRLSGITLKAERLEAGFVLWLDKRVRFTRGRLSERGRYLPVLEFRDLPEENEW